jgi:CRISPR-associated endonuclease/helicase Cas3
MERTVRGTLGFEAAFRALEASHRPPLKWQTRLYTRFVQGDVPGVCQLPTGLGKSSVIPIWLIALACGATLPRRLVYIVNRRTVVDQATDDAKRMLARLYRSGQRDGLAWATEEAIQKLGLESEPSLPSDHAAATKSLCLRLDALCTGGCTKTGQTAPLAISTLRGELADNGEWKKNPARPAIIIGTIDMIGSKLLFSGYGDGRYGRAHHAGLIGQDALVVHDEAHLSPAFDALLRSVAAEQARCGESRPIRVMSLSATTRGGGSEGNGGTYAGSPFGVEEEDRHDPVVSRRLGARKALTIVHADKVIARIAEEALELGKSPSRVLVYVRNPDDVAMVAAAIGKKLGDGGGARVARLTGTIRGKERDELAESEVFRAFKAGADRSSPLLHAIYLVSTSAGEVGADFDADHLVCDLTTLDSMAQRFGRVNRMGGDGRSARIVVVTGGAASRTEDAGKDEDAEESAGAEGGRPAGGKKRGANDYDAAVGRTGEILRHLAKQGGDASPNALSALLAKPEVQAAFSPTPKVLQATDILFDRWSLTSIAGEMPGRPEVGPYLHGVAEWEPPETHVAWRADIALLASAGGADDDGAPIPCSRDDLAEVFDAFPLRSTETLRDRTDRVQVQLQALGERLREVGTGEGVARAAGEEVEAEAGSEAEAEVEPDDRGEEKPVPPAKIPADPWVVLMRGGTVEWVRLSEIAPAEKEEAKRAQRRLAFATVVLPVEAGGLKEGMLVGTKPAPKDARSLDVAEAAPAGARGRQRLVNGRPLLGGDAIAGVTRATIALTREGDEDAEQSTLEYRIARGQDREPGESVDLFIHNDAVALAAERMGRALGLEAAVVAALRLAGKWHDAGKARAVWQQYAGNWDANEKRPRDGHPIAKSDRYGPWKMLSGYRHEFGSLLDAGANDDIRNLDDSSRDLVLHLIAAHHGWARPHFEPRHFDPGDPSKPRPTADNERQAVEVMQRFGRLQQRYGRWGLAWLESILRCADAAASDSRTPAMTGAQIGGRMNTQGGAA